LVYIQEVLSKLEKAYAGKYIFYTDSIKIKDKNVFFIGKDNFEKYLFLLGDLEILLKFEGKIFDKVNINGKQYVIKKAHLNYKNLCETKKIFSSILPVLCNQKSSFGTGDRLGIVTAAQVKAFKGKNLFPILAQQSERELSRTGKCWKDVINDATWGYFESGSIKPFGADADHVKDTSNLKEAVDAGFTMFTVDPSDYIYDISDKSKFEISKIYYSFNNLPDLEKKYLNKTIKLGNEKYFIDIDILVQISVKYLKAIEHVSSLYAFLKDYKRNSFDFEVSMDEIEKPVTPLEHYFIVQELNDRGIKFNNLALRFVGKWEKAIDYIGDFKNLEKNLKEHVQILKKFGEYKLSMHSGSEKFSTYKLFSEITDGNFHIKTAGTSWLEALRTIAKKNPSLFRDIFRFALEHFERDRDSYHLTTDTVNIINIDNVADDDLVKYLNLPEPRQILHVTYGSILNSRNSEGDFLYKERLYNELFKNEKTHYEYITSNIKKHLDLLDN